MGTYTVRPARASELAALQAVEMRAGQRFAEVGLPHVAAAPAMTRNELRHACTRGHLWVAADASDAPVGFAVAALVDGHAHLDELSVEPAHGGRGLGSRLLQRVCAWARAEGHRALTLSTFRDVPWNAPYYRRRGFVAMTPEEQGPELRARAQAEARRGLDPARRVCMRLTLE